MNRKQKIGVLTVLAAVLIISALVMGCFNEPETENGIKFGEGEGAVVINIAGSSYRTILPDITVSSFLSYRFVFTPVGGLAVDLGEPVKTIYRNAAQLSQPINMIIGEYDIEVTAYLDAYVDPTPPTQDVAEWSDTGIVITQGNINTITVILKAIQANQGTFAWDINLSGATLSSATMAINPRGAGTTTFSTTPINLSVRPNSSELLNADYYNVILTLNGGSTYGTFTYREILYIFKNLTSEFNFTFTDADFGKQIHLVTFASNYPEAATAANISINRLDGSALGILPPAPAHPAFVSGNRYEFKGWYTLNGTVGITTDWGTKIGDAGDNSPVPVNGNITYYAYWAPLNTGPIAPPTLEDLEQNPIEITYVVNGPGSSTTLSNNGSITIEPDDAITLTIANASDYAGGSIDWYFNDDSLSSSATLTLNSSTSLINSSDTGSEATYNINVEAYEADGTPHSFSFKIIIDDGIPNVFTLP